MATLLTRINEERNLSRERERIRLLETLRSALSELLPAGTRVWAFGSILKSGKFNEYSDIDIALESRPDGFSEFQLQGELERRTERRVDVLVLDETRFRSTIEREGKLWTL